MSEVHIELLLGKRVLGLNGRPVGRIEEFRAEPRDDKTILTEYLIGSYAFLERFSAWTIGRALLQRLGAQKKRTGYRVPWSKLDVSDPNRPRLTCRVEELQRLE